RTSDAANLTLEWSHLLELRRHFVLALQLIDRSHNRRHREALRWTPMRAVTKRRDRDVMVQSSIGPTRWVVPEPDPFAVRHREHGDEMHTPIEAVLRDTVV